MDPPDVIGADLGDARPTQLPGRAKSKRRGIIRWWNANRSARPALYCQTPANCRVTHFYTLSNVSGRASFPANVSVSAAPLSALPVAASASVSPEEPPPRPPQPAVLIKSKSASPQQLLAHRSCPLCSLLVPLLKGTPVFAVPPHPHSLLLLCHTNLKAGKLL